MYHTVRIVLCAQVMGTSGHVYTIDFCGRPACSCPDAKIRQGQCKHLLYLKLRVLQIPRASHLLRADTYAPHELRYVLVHADALRMATDAAAAAHSSHAYPYAGALGGGGGDRVGVGEEGGADAAGAARAARRARRTGDDAGVPAAAGGGGGGGMPDRVGAGAAVGSPRATAEAPCGWSRGGEPCSVCFDLLGSAVRVLLFCSACGNGLHTACARAWAAARAPATCPLCRTAWHSLPH